MPNLEMPKKTSKYLQPLISSHQYPLFLSTSSTPFHGCKKLRFWQIGPGIQWHVHLKWLTSWTTISGAMSKSKYVGLWRFGHVCGSILCRQNWVKLTLHHQNGNLIHTPSNILQPISSLIKQIDQTIGWSKSSHGGLYTQNLEIVSNEGSE